MAFLHVCHLPNFKKHCSNRCFIPVIALLLLVAVLAVTSTYHFTFPNRDIPLSWPSFSRQGRACDIFRGEWVPDPDAPYYTNDTCSVIHEHYDCMKYGKPDLGFVQWRWRPDGCDLPRVDPARFLDVMRGKTMAFVGDSLARNHMHSLICLLTRVAQLAYAELAKQQAHGVLLRRLQLHHRQLLGAVPGPARADRPGRAGAHGPVEPLRRRARRRVGGARPGVRLRRRVGVELVLPPFHAVRGRPAGGVLLLCLLPNVTDLTLRYALRMATRAALRAVNGRDGRFRGTAVLRTVSPSQYENGGWNKDGNCLRTRPYRRGENRIQDIELDFHTLQVEEFAAAAAAAGRVGGGAVRMMLMDTTEAMLMRADAHPSKYRGWTPEKYFKVYNDCVHWCLPGAIDTWNDMLLHMLTSQR